MDEILNIQGISKTYTDFKLDRVSIRVPKGAIMGFIGENGAGKTTTIKAILNLIEPEEGDIFVFGRDMKVFEKENKEDIGVVLSESSFPENMNIDHIHKVMDHIYKRWDKDLFYEYVSTYQLPKQKRIKDFSKGMRMKLAIACALAHHPKLLILDEATSGLDPIVRDEILEEFMNFIQDEEHSILLSSHITSDIEKVADYITFIHNGKIILSEAKDELLESYGILKASEEQFAQLNRDDYVSYRKSSFSMDVMIKNREAIRRQFKNAVIDPASLEDIMLFTVKGVRK